MADLQGVIEFDGVAQEAIKGFSFTLSHGISPSTGTIQVVPQEQPYRQHGTLSLTFGSTKISFPNCAIADVADSSTGEGRLLTLKIVDRRWKWVSDNGGGEISGWYNKRAASGLIQKEPFDFEKTPQELAKLCLDAMGESGYDVSRLPDGDDRPEVQWDHTNPAEALAELAELYGCRVVLGLDNRVRIVVDGEGPVLPLNGLEVIDGFGIDPPERPDALLFVGGPTKYQAQFELEPVGLDTDGKFKHIDKLSFKPSGGWDKEYPGGFDGVPDDIANDDVNDNTPFENNTAARQKRRLCMEWVFKAYRIKQEAGATIDLFDSAKTVSVTKLEQMLPLADGLAETYIDPLGAEKPKPEFIEGLMWRYGQAELNKNGRTTEGFNLDRERGIVLFSDYTYKLGTGGETLPAKLYLTCGVNLRDNKKFALDRYTKEKKLPGEKLNTGQKIVMREDVFKTLRVEYDSSRKPSKSVDNLKQLEKHVDFYLDQAAKEYETVETLTKRYAGWWKVEPDGATHQVTWSVDESGAFTEASQNSEHKRNIPNYAERRRREKVKAADGAIAQLKAILGKP